MQQISHLWGSRKPHSACRPSQTQCRPRLEELEPRCQPSVVNPTIGPIQGTGAMLASAPAVTAGPAPFATTGNVAQNNTTTPSSPGTGTQTTQPAQGTQQTSTNPASTSPGPEVVQQLQQGNTGPGGTLPAGVADPNSLSNLSAAFQAGIRTIAGLPFSSPATPPSAPFVSPLPTPFPIVLAFPLPTGGGGGLTGAGEKVRETDLRFEEEEEEMPQDKLDVPRNQVPGEVVPDLIEELPTEMQWAVPAGRNQRCSPRPAGLQPQGGKFPAQAGWLSCAEDSKFDLASALTVLAIPFLPSLETRDAALKDGQESRTGKWLA